MILVEMYEKIFLLSEVKMKFSIEQKVFNIRVYYATKSYKKSVGTAMKHGFTWRVLLILTIIVCGQVKIRMNTAS